MERLNSANSLQSLCQTLLKHLIEAVPNFLHLMYTGDFGFGSLEIRHPTQYCRTN